MLFKGRPRRKRRLHGSAAGASHYPSITHFEKALRNVPNDNKTLIRYVLLVSN